MFAQIESLTISQENQIKKLESELSRKIFLETKKDKHSKRLFRYSESLKESAQELINKIHKSHSKILSDIDTNGIVEKLSNLVKNSGGDIATAIDED